MGDESHLLALSQPLWCCAAYLSMIKASWLAGQANPTTQQATNKVTFRIFSHLHPAHSDGLSPTHLRSGRCCLGARHTGPACSGKPHSPQSEWTGI